MLTSQLLHTATNWAVQTVDHPAIKCFIIKSRAVIT